MVNLAFIPVRGGSKSILLKNIKNMNGKPLVYWTMKAACDCQDIYKVYVATDSKEIKDTVKRLKNEDSRLEKVEVIGRSEESASDTASTEFAMLEFAEKYNFDNIVLIQATSPLLSSGDLEKGIEIVKCGGADSVVSVVRQKRFHWAEDENKFAYPTNYDVYNRPRRQEFEGYLVENGAFYITSKTRLLDSKNRVSGRIKAVEMDEDTYCEIDEPKDWTIVESLMQIRCLEEGQNQIPEIKMLLTDCDGCLTDSGMYYSEKCDELKKFNTRDGVGFQLLKQAGILTGIVTSENVDLNKRRAAKMKLDILEEGVLDKSEKIKALSKEYHISLENIAYIGDEINDLQSLQIVGFSCCPADAYHEVKKAAHYITQAKGGEGVVREVADIILRNL